MSDGVVIVGLMIGLSLLIAGPISAWFFYQGRKNRALVQQSLLWPTVAGTVVASRVDEVMRRAGMGGRMRSYRPVVRYAYAVAGQPLESEVIQFGLTELNSQKQAQAFVQDRPVGAAVMVRYRPDDPKVAVLETSSYSADWQIRAGWIVLTLFPGLMLIVALFALYTA